MKLFKAFKSIVTNEPGFLDTYVFTKPGKTIYFQEMVHIGSSAMYGDINAQIKIFLENHPKGKIYLEGVHGTDKYKDACNEKILHVLGLQNSDITSLKDLYGELAKLSGLEVQKETNYLKDIPKTRLVKADMTFFNFLKKIEKIDLPEQKGVALNKEVFEKAGQYKIIGWAMKKFLQARLASKEGLPAAFKGKPHLDAFKKIILDDRNTVLLNMLEKTKDKDIFITYGAAHLKDIKDALIEQGYKVTVQRKVKF